MAYQKVFESSYPNGWQNLPNKTTPAYASTFDGYDEAIEHIEDFLDGSTAVKPVAKTEAMTQAVGIDPSTGALYTTPGGGGGSGEAEDIEYDNTESGLESDNVQGAIDELAAGAGNKITPVAKTSAMTQEVGWDSTTGELWTLPGQTIQELQLKGTWTKLLDVREESSQTDDSYTLKDSIFNYDTIVVHVYYEYQSKYIINSITIPTSQVILGDTTAWYIAGAANNDATIVFNSEGTIITKKTQSGATYIFAVYGYNGGSMNVTADYEWTKLLDVREKQSQTESNYALSDSVLNYDSIRVCGYILSQNKYIIAESTMAISQLEVGDASIQYQVSGDNGDMCWSISQDGLTITKESGSYYIFSVYGYKKKVYEPIISSLVRWYDGINNSGQGHDDTITSWVDLTGNQNSGTINANGWGENSLGQYGDSDKKVNIQYVYGTSPTTSITIEHYGNCGWPNSGMQAIGNTSASGMCFQVTSSSPQHFEFVLHNGSTYDKITSTKTLGKNENHHLVGTFDPTTKKAQFYLDGEKVGEITLTNYKGNTNPFYLGSNVTGDYRWKGGHYCARIYEKVLTEEEIQQNYLYCRARYDGEVPKDKYSMIQNGLVRWFDGLNNTGNGHDNAATSWKDLSGHQDIASVNNTIWSDKCVAPQGTFYFDIGYVYGSEPTTSLTMEVHVNTGNNQNRGQIISFTSNSGMNIQIEDNDLLATYIKDEDAYKSITTPIKKYSTVHVAITYNKDSKTLKFYVNGVLINSVTLSSYVGNNLTTKMCSNASGNSVFNGALYCARIYERELSASEIKQNYLYCKDRFMD